MKSASEDLLVGLAFAVSCLAVICGLVNRGGFMAWWQWLPKTVPLTLDCAGRTVFHGVTLDRVSEQLLSRVAAHGTNAVLVIDGGTNDFSLVAGAVDRVRRSGASVRADVSVSPTIQMSKLVTFADRLRTNGVGLSVRTAPTPASPSQ